METCERSTPPTWPHPGGKLGPRETGMRGHVRSGMLSKGLAEKGLAAAAVLPLSPKRSSSTLAFPKGEPVDSGAAWGDGEGRNWPEDRGTSRGAGAPGAPGANFAGGGGLPAGGGLASGPCALPCPLPGGGGGLALSFATFGSFGAGAMAFARRAST